MGDSSNFQNGDRDNGHPLPGNILGMIYNGIDAGIMPKMGKIWTIIFTITFFILFLILYYRGSEYIVNKIHKAKRKDIHISFIFYQAHQTAP